MNVTAGRPASPDMDGKICCQFSVIITTSLLDEVLNPLILSEVFRHPRLAIFSLIILATKIMKIRLSATLLSIGCILLASCYPYNENQSKLKNRSLQKAPEKSLTALEQETLDEQRAIAKEKTAVRRELANSNNPELPTISPEPNNPSSPPVREKRTDYSVATKAPGKEGFVLSPYNNKLVDVRDIASGTLVQDPTYTGDGKGYFRVP